MNSKLKNNIEYLKGVGPVKAELLRGELNIFNWNDLLTHFPFRYVDKSKYFTISEAYSQQDFIQVKGIISKFETRGAGRKKRLHATFVDPTGQMELVWFSKIDWILKSLKSNIEYVVYGKASKYGRTLSISHPEIRLYSQTQKLTNHLEPVYPSTEKLRKNYLDSKGISKLQRLLLEQIDASDLHEVLPLDVLESYKLMTRTQAYKEIHFPSTKENLQQARFRIKFEELLVVQLRILKNKITNTIQNKGFVFENIDHHFNSFYQNKLPFKLTSAQKKVLKEIRKDTLSGKQMNRLLQGDVGSGKTIVSLMAMLMAIDNNFQACIMAPTEILAQQHFESIQGLLKGTSVTCALLTGSTNTSTRKELFKALKSGHLHILIGTHALLEDPVVFKNLGLAVIDEQHRFGVAQRAKLWNKNHTPPHILVMTATPIPRTLAMTLYGDLDLSVIDELPPGRKPINTLHKKENQRITVFNLVQKELNKGRQAYFVYPLIEESESMDYNHLLDGYESIKRAFPNTAISMVHGKMKAQDKEYEMQQFAKGNTQIMVATTVIEVGVNVPNASIMVIESAERFGLSQLHQLRGRVGRGAAQSYCVLLTGLKLSANSLKRMNIMRHTNDGFVIAEEDLKLRGPGDIEGTQQSGIVDLKLSNLAKDSKILSLARTVAITILNEDPFLDLHKNSFLKNYLLEMSKHKKWGNIA